MLPVQNTVIEKITLVDYDPRYQPDFYRLNRAWIEPNFGMEEEDVRFLTDPQAEIIDKGGAVFFALLDDVVVGTGGLFKMDDETYELIRFAVDEQYRGLKIGKKLVDYSIDVARQKNATRVILETSSKPVNETAIKLYERAGFTHYTPRQEHRSALDRADVFMMRALD